MLYDRLNTERKRIVTSDRWHVVHAEWTGGAGTPRFVRKIVSEHDDIDDALASGRRLKAELRKAELRRGAKKRSADARDQILVRRPHAESLESAGRVARKP